MARTVSWDDVTSVPGVRPCRLSIVVTWRHDVVMPSRYRSPVRTRSSSRSFSVGSVAAKPRRFPPPFVNSFITTCALPAQNTGSRRAQAMTQQPVKRIPQWLRIDLLVIVVSLAIIGIYIFYIA